MDEQILNPEKETKISFNHTRFSIDSNFKLPTFDWLQNIPVGKSSINLIEVRFKNTRKGIYNNVNLLRLKKGDVVAVEASPGHDIGIISLAGEIVNEQLRKLNLDPSKNEFKKIYRLAKEVDIEKWKEAQELENLTMLKARKIAADLNLNMKIGDVEYQGDRTKAIFYYIAEERVDFRELIKVLADQFKVRIEMRQIGARQEAGRIGGIGSCGRELCCSTWMTNFVSVSTNAARHQELSLNPQKLAGQCGKLKCCLNYELDIYIEAQKGFPSSEIYLETNDGTIYHKKTDIFKRIMWYSFDKKSSLNQFPVSVDRVFKIIEENKKGNKPELILSQTGMEKKDEHGFQNVVGQESLTRFDNKGKREKRSKRHKKRRR